MPDLFRALRRACLIAAIALLPALAAHGAESHPAESSATDPPLTLTEALALALQHNPTLAAYDLELRASEAEILQAGVRPNPTLALEIEGIRPGSAATASTTRGFGGEAAFDGGAAWGIVPGFAFTRERERGGSSVFGAAEATLSVAQTFELGGKRAARVRLASAERDAARWDYEIARADVLTQTAQRYLDALTAQRRVDLTAELVRISDDVANTVSDLVASGKNPPLELPRAEAVRDELRIDVTAAHRTLRAAYAALAAMWADPLSEPRPLAGAVEDAQALPPLASLLERAAANPDIARWQSELARADATIALERAMAKPDLELSIGLRARGLEDARIEEVSLGLDGLGYRRAHTRPDDDYEWTIVAGASMALPIFDRNVGAIRAAEHRAARTAEERRAAEVDVAAAIARMHQEATARYDEAAVLQTNILPKVEEVHALTREGYEYGKFDYLEVLETARALVEVRTRLFDAHVAWHAAHLELGRLLGEPALDYAHTDGVPAPDADEEIQDEDK